MWRTTNEILPLLIVTSLVPSRIPAKHELGCKGISFRNCMFVPESLHGQYLCIGTLSTQKSNSTVGDCMGHGPATEVAHLRLTLNQPPVVSSVTVKLYHKLISSTNPSLVQSHILYPIMILNVDIHFLVSKVKKIFHYLQMTSFGCHM